MVSLECHWDLTHLATAADRARKWKPYIHTLLHCLSYMYVSCQSCQVFADVIVEHEISSSVFYSKHGVRLWLALIKIFSMMIFVIISFPCLTYMQLLSLIFWEQAPCFQNPGKFCVVKIQVKAKFVFSQVQISWCTLCHVLIHTLLVLMLTL